MSVLDMLFQTTKIQIFESNSQPMVEEQQPTNSCFRQQRYKFLKAIHNCTVAVSANTLLFQTTKIQIFESNSQHSGTCYRTRRSCFRQQRYKFLKAIHNEELMKAERQLVVSDNKDTNF